MNRSVSIHILSYPLSLLLLLDGGSIIAYCINSQRDPIICIVEFKWYVDFIPEFRMESTRFEDAHTSYGALSIFWLSKGRPLLSVSFKYRLVSFGCCRCSTHSTVTMAPSAQNIYSKHLGSRLETQIWSSTSRQTPTKSRQMGLGMQYSRLLLQVHHFAGPPITQLTQESITDVFLETRSLL